MRTTLALLVPVLLSACAAVPAPLGREDEAAVAASVMGMYGAFQQRDLAKVGAFMTPGSTCYDATASVLLQGRDAVLAHFGAILGEHKPGEVWKSTIEGMTVRGEGDLAWATYQVKTSQGGRHAAAAVTHVFRREDGRWLAVHLHRSWNAKSD